MVLSELCVKSSKKSELCSQIRERSLVGCRVRRVPPPPRGAQGAPPWSSWWADGGGEQQGVQLASRSTHTILWDIASDALDDMLMREDRPAPPAAPPPAAVLVPWRREDLSSGCRM